MDVTKRIEHPRGSIVADLKSDLAAALYINAERVAERSCQREAGTGQCPVVVILIPLVDHNQRDCQRENHLHDGTLTPES